MADFLEGMRIVSLRYVVADIEKSARFYCGAFGFRRTPISEFDAEPGSKFAQMFRHAGRGRMLYLVRPEIKIGIRQLDDMPSGAPTEAANHIGGDGLFFRAENPRAVAAKAVELGGKIHYDDKTIDPNFDVYDTVYLTDPDGIIIQIANTPLDVIEKQLVKTLEAGDRGEGPTAYSSKKDEHMMGREGSK